MAKFALHKLPGKSNSKVKFVRPVRPAIGYWKYLTRSVRIAAMIALNDES